MSRQGFLASRMLASILLFLTIGIVLIVPVLLLWGWLRWARNKDPRTTSSTLSLLGLSFSTASALLALFTHLYARFVRSFPFHDPALLIIYVGGCLFSSAAILFAIGGSGRKGPVRWIAPACAFGTLLFWLIAISSE
jgi:hypothetical protein